MSSRDCSCFPFPQCDSVLFSKLLHPSILRLRVVQVAMDSPSAQRKRELASELANVSFDSCASAAHSEYA